MHLINFNYESHLLVVKIDFLNCIRSIPVEVLHAILLGASKYMLRTFMDKLNASQKKEILARIASFCYCGFSVRITGNIAYHYKSFIGRDFKAWMQMALFIIHGYITNDEKRCWLALSKVKVIKLTFSTLKKNHIYISQVV